MTLLLMLVLACSSVYAADTPITPGASPEAQSLLSFLSDIYGKKELSGQHEGWRGTNELGPELTYIHDTTGKLPAILSQDLIGYTRPEPTTHHRNPSDVVSNAIDWYQNRNGIVTFCWHWYAPTAERAFYTKDTSFDLTRGMTEGTEEHVAILRDLDTVAGALERLRDAHVPVLWRPLHEMNGRWFWWGAQGPEPFKKLWRLMFNRLTFDHSLTNLLWVFSPGAATDLADWYPGDAYVDLIGQDHYPMDGNTGPAKDVFDELTSLTGGTKMIGMSENGPIPDPDQVVSEKADWLFFITWAGNMLKEKNPADHLVKVYHNPHVLNLSDLPDLKRYSYQSAGTPTRLAFPAPPTEVAVRGTRRRPVTVAVQDDQGRTVRNDETIISIALRNNSDASLLSGTLTASTINGIATFPDLAISEAGDDFELIATASGLREAASAPFQVGPGSGILREWWSNVDDLHAATLPSPAGQERLTKALEYPVTMVTNYTARYRGVLLPPQTGTYIFWLANTARSELWLGTDESPASKVKIGEITPNTPYSKWPHINEARSKPVRLVAGKRYYFELLHRQRHGSAQLAVRWRLPDGTEERPIPGCRFDPPETGDGVMERWSGGVLRNPSLHYSTTPLPQHLTDSVRTETLTVDSTPNTRQNP